MDDDEDIKTVNKVLPRKVIDSINKRLVKKHFKFEKKKDNSFDFDYMFKILPETKKMIRIGDWTEFYTISVTIFNLNDTFKKVLTIFKDNNFDFDENNGVMELMDLMNQLNMLRQIEQEILEFLSPLNINPIIIKQILVYSSELELDTKQLNEIRMNRLAIRTIVKDILNTVKEKKEGSVYLPEDITGELEYEFLNTKQSYSVELTLVTNNIIGGYKIEGNYSPNDDVIEIGIEYNPNTVTKQLYELAGELNEVLAHEMEHSTQEYYDEFDRVEQEPDTPIEYYTQEHEIPAQYQGFKRLSKLRKVPMEVVVNDWFDTHRDIHGLTPDEEQQVINQILNYQR
jgi:hypothetical protein